MKSLAKNQFSKAGQDVPGRNLKNRRVFANGQSGVPDTHPAWKHDQMRRDRLSPNAKASLNARTAVKNDKTL